MTDRVATTILGKLGHPINTSAVMIMAVYTFVWGLWVVNPFWDVFRTAPTYSALMQVLPEVVWGIFATTVGLVMIYGVIRSSFKSLTTGAFAGALHWMIICGGYFAGDWQNTAGITTLMITIYCSFVYLNLKVNRDNLPFKTRRDNI